jgi:carbamoyl-phosphate synthase small subunit
MSKAYLVLSDGSVYEGTSFGAPVTAAGELVFNTSVVGYNEILTDPSYAGQIILHTFPMVGNYGVIEEAFDGECHISGCVVREHCEEPSNFRAEYTLDKFLKDRNIPGICGVDTRALTRKLRDHGPLNAMICAEIPEDNSAISSYKVTGAVAKVACKESYVIPAADEERLHTVVIDCGMKKSFAAEWTMCGKVTVVPCGTSAEEILALNPAGVLISNGPGDPAELDVTAIRALMGKVPMFGIGLGHQLMAIAAGASTVKMPYGHRGGNQPVKETASGRTYITVQNHGYAVVSESVKNGVVSFVNANDGTCEGIDYPEMNAFSVQFYPTAGGPRSTAFLFERFITMMGGEN